MKWTDELTCAASALHAAADKLERAAGEARYGVGDVAELLVASQADQQRAIDHVQRAAVEYERVW